MQFYINTLSMIYIQLQTTRKQRVIIIFYGLWFFRKTKNLNALKGAKLKKNQKSKGGFWRQIKSFKTTARYY